MKIIFAGTPSFAASALEALVKEHSVVAVLSQPDRPAGRGLQLTASPVKQLALQQGIPVLQPSTLKSPEIQRDLAEYHADVMVVAAYGLILPQAVLDMPKHGCLNIHASLLPRWRGAAPIQRAILAGDIETGITTMQMDAGLDTGDMLQKHVCAISASDTAETLHDKLAVLGAQAILDTLQKLEAKQLQRQSQNNELATYAAKLSKQESLINWSLSAEQLDRAVRGYFPFPIANTTLMGTPIKVLRACVGPTSSTSVTAGTVIGIDKENIWVACGEGSLGLMVLQKPGGKALPINQFLQGFPIKVGDRFGAE
ncbi:MAG: methionyl-tRNA formyltransferase [Sideroxydans sp.]|nr:methionyl-tRNA formyltransferase [Sideroxydans sp.]